MQITKTKTNRFLKKTCTAKVTKTQTKLYKTKKSPLKKANIKNVKKTKKLTKPLKTMVTKNTTLKTKKKKKK